MMALNCARLPTTQVSSARSSQLAVKSNAKPTRTSKSMTTTRSLRNITTKASNDAPSSNEKMPDPDSIKSAIAIGLQLFEQKRYEDAQAYFERALSGELPGSGIKRFRDKPKLISDGEKQSALFNIACVQAQLGETQNGLIALAGCLEAGYDNFRQIRTDPDLAPLRQDAKFEGLMSRFEKKNSGFMGLFKSM